MSALLGAGFEPGDLETVLGIELHAPRETGGLPPGVEIRIVRDPRELADVSAISRALGRRNVEGETRALATALHDRPSAISVHVLYEDDNPAACGRIHYGRVPGVAELAGGRTVPSQRRRGFFRALVESRLREAAAQGSRYVFVDALPSSHHILTRLGFAAVTTTQPYIYPA
jgi:GNAT superfamily N-acetyltransferase